MSNGAGRKLVYRATLLLFAVLPCVSARAANCVPELLAEVNLLITPDGGVFMPATIGGRPVYFSLSLGNGLPGMLESSAKPLGLVPKRINGTGKFSKGITHFVMLEDLKVGGVGFARRAAPLLPQTGGGNEALLDGRLVAGSMGSTLFQRVDVELNLAERQMKLFKSFQCPGQSPAYWNPQATRFPAHFDEAEALVFTLELNGKKVEASMLSGARESTLDANAASRFFGIEAQSGVNGAGTTFHPMSLTGPGLAIPENKVMLRQGSCELSANKTPYGGIGYKTCINSVPFKLGLDLLTQMRIYVASARESVYITFNPTAPPAD